MKPAAEGMSATLEIATDEAHTASAAGNPGVHVVATTALILFLEEAAHRAIAGDVDHNQAADWLTEHTEPGPTAGRVLVVPGAPFANQVWGNTHDEPLQVLGEFPWGVRDSIPLTPPQTIRAPSWVRYSSLAQAIRSWP